MSKKQKCISITMCILIKCYETCLNVFICLIYCCWVVRLYFGYHIEDLKEVHVLISIIIFVVHHKIFEPNLVYMYQISNIQKDIDNLLQNICDLVSELSLQPVKQTNKLKYLFHLSFVQSCTDHDRLPTCPRGKHGTYP
jgi:hypothetical protein